VRVSFTSAALGLPFARIILVVSTPIKSTIMLIRFLKQALRALRAEERAKGVAKEMKDEVGHWPGLFYRINKISNTTN